MTQNNLPVFGDRQVTHVQMGEHPDHCPYCKGTGRIYNAVCGMCKNGRRIVKLNPQQLASNQQQLEQSSSFRVFNNDPHTFRGFAGGMVDEQAICQECSLPLYNRIHNRDVYSEYILDSVEAEPENSEEQETPDQEWNDGTAPEDAYPEMLADDGDPVLLSGEADERIGRTGARKPLELHRIWWKTRREQVEERIAQRQKETPAIGPAFLSVAASNERARLAAIKQQAEERRQLKLGHYVEGVFVYHDQERRTAQLISRSQRDAQSIRTMRQWGWSDEQIALRLRPGMNLEALRKRQGQAAATR